MKQRLVVGRKRDGRNCYDPEAKRELIEAGLQPGVSVAKLALTHGVNANLLRTWMTKHQRQLLSGSSRQGSAPMPKPFIPVVPVSVQQPLSAPSELAAQLPNGVRVEWSALPAEQLALVLRLLTSLPCSESTRG